MHSKRIIEKIQLAIDKAVTEGFSAPTRHMKIRYKGIVFGLRNALTILRDDPNYCSICGERFGDDWQHELRVGVKAKGEPKRWFNTGFITCESCSTNTKYKLNDILIPWVECKERIDDAAKEREKLKKKIDNMTFEPIMYFLEGYPHGSMVLVRVCGSSSCGFYKYVKTANNKELTVPAEKLFSVPKRRIEE